MSNPVLEFINRRFPKDCNWLDGNCYYFAIILRERFTDGVIFYDVIDGHFVTQIGGVKYDWSGIVSEEGLHHYVRWSNFNNYDSFQTWSVIKGCIL